LNEDGRLVAWLSKSEQSVLTFFRDEPRERTEDARVVASVLTRVIERGQRRAFLISQVDGADVAHSPLGEALLAVGFQAMSRGYFKRGQRPRAGESEADEGELDLVEGDTR